MAAALALLARPAMAAPAPADCAALMSAAGRAWPEATTRIESAVVAQPTPAAAAAGPPGAAPGSPEGPAPLHCNVHGLMQQRLGADRQTYAIRFHMRLPVQWNGGLVFQGGGGSDGVVGSALGPLLGGQTDNALSRGYAVVSDDAGHDNRLNNDPALQGPVTFGWDPQARRNYGYAAIGPVAATAKAMVRAYYGRPARRTYFVGGSKGGQEALMAAERFPGMFDGVLAGYPGLRLAYAGAVGQVWDAQSFAKVAEATGAFDARHLPLIGRAFTDADLAMVSKAVLAACDGLDGAVDGMVNAFTRCTTRRVEPELARLACAGDKTLSCLSPVQIAALRRVFDGARTAAGAPIYSDWSWDAGVDTPGWRAWKLGRYDADANTSLAVILGGASSSAVFTSPPTPVEDKPEALTRYVLGADVAANARAVATPWGRFRESAADFMDADSADLSRFAAHGGKIIVFHGGSDPVFSLRDTARWWDRVDRAENGRAARFVRLFDVPGMNHGGGGPATDRFDAFSALVAWVEEGRAPERLIATAGPRTPWPGRTRPLCPYPLEARAPRPLSGEALEQADSFICSPAPRVGEAP